MDIIEIENFVKDKRKVVKEFFENNPEENVFTVLFELVDKNLDIINKFKNDCEKSGDEKEKDQLKDMIKKMMDSVVNSLSVTVE